MAVAAAAPMNSMAFALNSYLSDRAALNPKDAVPPTTVYPEFNPPHVLVNWDDITEGVNNPRVIYMTYLFSARDKEEFVTKIKSKFAQQILQSIMGNEKNLACDHVRDLYIYLEYYFITLLEKRYAEWIAKTHPRNINSDDANPESPYWCILAQAASYIRSAVRKYARSRTTDRFSISASFMGCPPSKLEARNRKIYGSNEPNFNLIKSKTDRNGQIPTCQKMFIKAKSPNPEVTKQSKSAITSLAMGLNRLTRRAVPSKLGKTLVHTQSFNGRGGRRNQRRKTRKTNYRK